ncbi:MAG: LytTR family DNA-binding domain-containing protein [Saprospiraceae bacterium]|nr:LytTR family DNA-binding domain-containing protein [Saprospiraceae bacterium]
MQTAYRSAKRIQLTPVRAYVPTPTPSQHIVVHTLEFIELLHPDEIQYVRAESNYCVFVMQDGHELMASKTLGSFERHLQAHGFIRPHQSYLVNTSFVRRIRKSSGYALCMRDDTEIPIARARRTQIVDQFTG